MVTEIREPSEVKRFRLDSRDLVIFATFGLLHLVSRLLFFSGYVLGDDSSYARLADEILRGKLPPACEVNVFASRPLLLFLISISVKLFGWSEHVFIMPVLLSSVVIMLCLMCLARLMGGREASIFVGIAFLFFGFDMSRATTMSNDIVATAMLVLGIVFFVLSIRYGRNGFAVLGGILLGAMTGVKLLYAVCPVAIVLAGFVFKRDMFRYSRQIILLGAGFMLMQTGLMLFFQYSVGNPLAHWIVERDFNTRYMMTDILSNRVSLLLFYPKMMLGPLPKGIVYGYEPFRYAPYGLLFVIGIPIALVLLVMRNVRCNRGIFAVCISFLVWFMILEFWPFSTTPRYCPIHRLDRTFYIVAVHIVLLTGLGMARLWEKGIAWRSICIILCCSYVLSGVVTALAATRLQDDFMQDPRTCAKLVRMTDMPVFTDPELVEYLNFATSFKRPNMIMNISQVGNYIGLPAWVIVGGTRRPEMEPSYTSSFAPRPIPENWTQLLRLPGKQTIWRPLTGLVYLVKTAGACVSETGNVVQVNVGDSASELAHGYAIGNQTWFGTRKLLDETSAASIAMDGRAFREYQEFYVTVPSDSRSMIIDKVVDARVRNQLSRWLIAGVPVGEMKVEDGGGWKTVRLVVPIPKGLTLRPILVREEYLQSDADINCFLVRFTPSSLTCAEILAAQTPFRKGL